MIEASLEGNKIAQVMTKINVNIPRLTINLFKNDNIFEVPNSKIEAEEFSVLISTLENGGLSGIVSISSVSLLDVLRNKVTISFEPRESNGVYPVAIKFDKDQKGNAVYIVQLEKPRMIPIRTQVERIIDFVSLPITASDAAPVDTSFVLHIAYPEINIPRDLTFKHPDTLLISADDLLLTTSGSGMKLELAALTAFFTVTGIDYPKTKLLTELSIIFVSIIDNGFTLSSCTVDPILIRLSYKEALLIQEMQGYLLSSTNTQFTSDNPPQTNAAIMREKLKVSFELRIIIIDDLNNLHLPMVDIHLSKLICDLTDRNISETNVNVAINYFNIRNSNWEPLLEPWHFILNVNYSLFNY